MSQRFAGFSIPRKVLEVFKNLAQTGKTVLIVTHNPEVAEYADVIIKMKDGEVVEEVKK